MTQSLRPLLDLQEVDLARDRLTDRRIKLPERTKLTELESRMGEVRGAVAVVDNQLQEIGRETIRLETELQQKEEKITRDEARLYGGEVVNPKELSALQADIEMLNRQRGPLEEKALEQMVARDEASAERKRLEAELADLEREAQTMRDTIATLESQIDRELASESARREEIAPQIPGDVLELYAHLRETKKGVGAGALESGICSACREALSAVEVDRIRHAARAGELNFRCEHCRRILVVQ